MQQEPVPGALSAQVVVRAPAKINLTLEILRRRADGYHDVKTVMQAIDLADELAITLERGEGITVAVEGAELPAGRSNLAFRAAELVLEAIRARGAARAAATGSLREVLAGRYRVSMHLKKRIPVAAGLGGGSADAAAVLAGLNHLMGCPLGSSEIGQLAAQLGSDVPFFLVGGTCLATGRGEELRRLPPLPPLWIVLVAPGVAVETQWAYEARAEEELTAQGASSSILEFAIRERSCSRIARGLVNDLEEVVARRYGVVAGVLEELRTGDIIGARMSGSGSAAYALVVSEAEARRLADALNRRDHPVHVCRPFRSGCQILPASGMVGAASGLR